ncbi:PIN domain-containing protein [Micromonospora echinofusca]|uniref:PIN domain-containing protein n=1 Tax=Micromonospora echinofusca TaxID=47858 RepID=UPI0037164654
MWNFLRSGRDGTQAAADLEDLVQELDRLAGGLPTNPVVAASSYLMWAEKAEHRLLATYQSFAIPRQLHSDRYWRIRSMDTLTSRPMPLIAAEIEMQKRHLAELLAQLRHYSSMLALPAEHWIIVPDTNVYVHGRLFHEVEWHREIGARRASIVMPLVVLDELDRIKDRDPEFGRRARSVLRALDRITADKEWLTPIQLRQNVWLQLVDEPAGHHRQQGQDDEIVRQSGYFAQLNGGRLILLTRDRGMRLRAQAAGLTSRTLPEHLERIRAATT